MIVDLKTVLEGVTIEELEEALNKKRQQQKTKDPTIFQRFPVGSLILGIKIENHDIDDTRAQILISDGAGYCMWLSKKIATRLAACHDWIERYAPVLEEARKRPLSINETPIKKPWEEDA